VFLALDIGNTRVKVGVFREGCEYPETADFPSGPAPDAGECARLIRAIVEGRGGAGESVKGVAMATVVREWAAPMREAIREVFGADIVEAGAGETGGMKVLVREPGRLGPDRIASAVGARELLGSPAVSVDIGTATTVNFVSVEGDFMGGAILPGPRLMLRSLGEGTAALPVVEPGDLRGALGRDTEEALLVGAILGTAGAVERIVLAVEREVGYAFRVAVTGGGSSHVVPHLGRCDLHEPHLTLIGLHAMYYGRRSHA
jgi:type III pantothenate kinase